MTRPTIAIVGAGGIGHPCIAALAHLDASLRIIDDDRVEVSNLHRLAYANDGDVGSYKAVISSKIRGEFASFDKTIVDRIVPSNALTMFRGCDLVIEGSDNFPTKFLVADACGLLGIPSVHGAAVGWIGTVLPVLPNRTACYRCIFEDIPTGDAIDCATAGVYGPITSVIGAIMAADAMRIIRGDFSTAGRIASYFGWKNTFRTTGVARRSDCTLCGSHRIETLAPERYVPPECAA